MKPSFLKISKLLLLFLIPFLLSFDIKAQTIEQIRFIGLKRTKYSYLRDRIIKTKTGDIVDSLKIRRDAQEIYNLRHFSKVNFIVSSLDSIKNTVSLDFIIEESYSLLPVADAGLTKDFLRLQIGVVDFNTFGRGGNFNLYAKKIGRVTYLFNGDFPFLYKRHGMAADISKAASFEPIWNGESKNEFSYDLYTLLLMHRYDFNLRSFLKTGAGFQYEDYVPYNLIDLQTNYPSAGSSRRFAYRVNYRFTKINLTRMLQKGFYFDMNFTGSKSFTTNENELYGSTVKLLLDYRKYFRPYEKGNFVVRLRLGIGESALFDQFILDDNTNIRGIGFKRVRRDHEFVINIENRHTIYHRNLFDFQFVLFNDYTPGHNYFGGGLRLYVEPLHGVVFRADYGMNINDITKGGIVAGIHQYF